jgi:V/A-type H+-transporting ATPase subunit I
VALKNNKITKPFEMITKLYGMPKPLEVDPTPFLAPFFVVFFGFALSDAGYGVFLVLLGFSLLFLSRKGEIFRNIGLLSLFTGMSTLIFGWLLGTFFGVNLSKFIDPQLEPMKVLGLCFALGILQIISGLLISFWHKVKHGVRFIDALNEQGFWILVLSAFFLLIIQNVFNLTFISSKHLLNFSFLLLFANLLTTTIFSPKIISGFLKGLAGLYSGVGFLADTLSYSRLFALGLATGVVAYTVNLVAGILKEMINIPVLSQLIFFTVLIVGHLFNIAINVLGSFIHSSRLQFVEFFSKFLEGGGRQFNPLKFN